MKLPMLRASFNRVGLVLSILFHINRTWAVSVMLGAYREARSTVVGITCHTSSLELCFGGWHGCWSGAVCQVAQLIAVSMLAERRCDAMQPAPHNRGFLNTWYRACANATIVQTDKCIRGWVKAR